MARTVKRPAETLEIQVAYIKMLPKYKHLWRGAKLATYASREWSFSKTQASRIMLDVDTWSDEQRALLLAIYEGGKNE